MSDVVQPARQSRAEGPAWGAVVSMTFGVFALVTAEFLPASLLTPMAADLRISEGVAGQTVTVTAAVALVTSLLIPAATRRVDRRHVLLAFSVLLILSNLLVAFAPGLTFLLLGRVLLGIALGGFWTMSAAVAMRLVPEPLVPRALSMIFSGVSAATILAAPVGSYLGEIIGWRNVFLITLVLGVVTLVAQFATLPRMAPSGLTRLRTLADVLMRPGIALGMLAAMLVFTGHFAFFTYIRPFLETATGAGIGAVSAILLGFGIANFLGTLLAGPLLERNLRLTLIAMPLLMGALGVSLVTLVNPAVDAVMVALWGLAFGAVPVAWSTWLTRTVPDQAESAGGLLVAAVQLAIAVGAAAGGMLYDFSGASGVFSASSLVLLVAGLIIVIGVRSRPAVEAV
ncbi:MFS transporter [Bradyrhizobium sp. U87765 SZCCT0131]|uniref:MFS transporter n=1 Tax=unclassified Bradyrhizobium TaxID=2631580 RepID=UPI001BAA5357|nr:MULTISPECIES: MFS transporter [unclassified Bradyrhizobium]MBR1216889.1 MFS transporter [Bradyrhizobium sp. U87765 SZCCT0131]MBR1259355.1 MFS transporter [Bradyrhizobium sp. U87765 SZCCT0134]MBR1305496.1 MFS transporter [Bradyrhizobium sp. U87765 SZCCT0110]MBR1321863.1 MFS transporter [Bradyrhizobium sp. U87765 SZCCT0109]MBR1350859.1 MFS transporter [Bradyrhizobium sp. U87765 SZCCT0048]